MIYFTSWSSLLQIFISVVAIYVGLILMLRISGNRTLSQMNSFDFIITIAMGLVLETNGQISAIAKKISAEDELNARKSYSLH